MKTVLVLCGGRSTEHEIALRSARSVINELDRKQYDVQVVYVDKNGCFVPIGALRHVDQPTDLIRKANTSRLASIEAFCAFVATLKEAHPDRELIVFPVIHGQTGEDGEIQGFLQTLGLPYVGCRLTASALCMDKGFANEVLRSSGIPEADFLIVTRQEWAKAGESVEKLSALIKKRFGFPCFVKPANNGSSVGVTKATEDNVGEAVREAFRYDRRIVIEEEIQGHEVEISVLGNGDPKASLPGSYSSTHEVLDYEAKYNDQTTIENVPHPLPPERTKAVQELALQAYRALGCEGFARVDIFINDEGIYVNEINTFPGMTPSSLAPKLWTSLTDMTFSDYLDEIIANAEASQGEQSVVETSWGRA